MKKLITIAMFAFASFAYAGDYHYGEELKCQQCHTMHYSQQHGFEVLADQSGVYATGARIVAGGPWQKLLIGGSTNAACLACHNRGGGYDVYGGGGSGVRSAGALNKIATSTLAAPGTSTTVGGQEAITYQPQMGHSLDFTGQAPGNGPSFPNGFNCGDCHEVHGNAAYRNLGPEYSSDVVFAVGEQPTFTVDATATQGNPAYDVTETDHAAYNTADVFFGSNGSENRMNAYCAKCHGQFHGNANTNAAAPFIRHPTGNTTTTVNFSMTDPSGRYTAKDIVRPVYTSATNVSPGCLTCHKAHGNARPYALVFPDGAQNDNLEEGDLLSVRDHRNNFFWSPRVLCNTCHHQGKD